MKNETDEQIADQVLDLQSPTLTSKQEKQRNTQI
jgi:hypothetical protein